MSTPTRSSAKLGYPEYASIPDDGLRHEIIEGKHYVNPAPSTYHQTVSRRIQFQLYTQIEVPRLGEIFNAPTDLQLSPHDIVQPDLIVVLAPHRAIITPSKINGIPDLVVEILSPTSEAMDRGRKKDRYEHAGIPEYWVVYPFERFVEQFRQGDSGYTWVDKHEKRIEFLGMPGVVVDLRDVW